MPAQKDRWFPSFSFLLFCAYFIPMLGSTSLLQELSPQEYFSGLQAGRASLAYFSPNVSPGAQPFLEQIENSVEALQDYGISVVKVSCPKEDVSRYCGKENALRKAYLFRGNMLIREFPTDALFDVNSIVANVLFALLFNEVKYVETLTDLQNIENALKGKSNMVFAYVPATGTAEHRAVMEVAFVYGTVHQFVLTTEATLLKDASSDEPDASSARLLFCHCQQATDVAQPCRKTPMEQDLTMLNIHRHLKLMGAPLVECPGPICGPVVAPKHNEWERASFKMGWRCLFDFAATSGLPTGGSAPPGDKIHALVGHRRQEAPFPFSHWAEKASSSHW